MKRSGPIKRTSASKRKERRETDGPRAAYRIEFPTCQLCERRKSRETHEIASGTSARKKAVYHRAAWLAVCRECHREIHNTMAWPIARQLYIKWRDDPDYYSRELVNVLRGTDPEAITQEEVDQWK